MDDYDEFMLLQVLEDLQHGEDLDDALFNANFYDYSGFSEACDDHPDLAQLIFDELGDGVVA